MIHVERKILDYFSHAQVENKSKELLFFFKNTLDNFKNKTINNELKNINFDKNNTEKFIELVFYLSKEPLTSYKDLADKVNISKNTFMDFIKIIREIDVLQKIIITDGLGSKYWINTILPLLKSNSINNFLNQKYSYPFRVGLFPGISCMFECSFCGRNYDAVYKRSSLDQGMQDYFNLIDEAPTEDPNRFYISGGLEPLTNPKLTMLFDKLREKKFNSSLYTNAFMLTKKYLQKNPSFFDLNSMRISFYGVDDQKTFEVTKKKNAFEVVTNNIFNYLVEKNEKNSKTSFGLNFVILQNRSDDLIKLLKLISKINRRVNSQKKNNFDFLTLREDFRIFGSRIDEEEKIKLIKNISLVEKMVKEDEYLNGLFIDYGFALEPLKKGFLGNKFDDIFASLEDLKILGVPQASVSVDLYGDVYLYRESAFLDRPGAKKYIIGNLHKDKNMKTIIENFTYKPKQINILESDRDYLDSWDHVTVKLANQIKKNKNYGYSIDNSAINIENSNFILNSSHQVHYSK